MTATRGRGRPGGPEQTGRPARAPDRTAAAERPHDPRIDPPTKADRRRFFGWVAFLSVAPVCVGAVIYAAVNMNGSYPTVKPPVPTGWKAVPGIYASFSAPRSWSLQQDLSDSAGDIFFGGRGGGVGESVVEAKAAPAPGAPLPAIVKTFLGGRYTQLSRRSTSVANAQTAWDYRFALPGGRRAEGVEAWVKGTESLVWLVAVPSSPTGTRVLSTLTLAP